MLLVSIPFPREPAVILLSDPARLKPEANASGLLTTYRSPPPEPARAGRSVPAGVNPGRRLEPPRSLPRIAPGSRG